MQRCDWCKTEPARTPLGFCSKRCSESARTRTRVHTTCRECGKACWSYPSVAPRLYCSRKCAGIGRRRRAVISCARCGKEFEGHTTRPRKYCSQECACVAPVQRVQRACGECGKEYHVLPRQAGISKYCSRPCKQRGTGRERQRGPLDSRTRLQRNGWRKIRLRIIERDGRRCTRCGAAPTKGLSVHHKVRWEDSRDDSDANLVTLCRKCHRLEEAEHNPHARVGGRRRACRH